MVWHILPVSDEKKHKESQFCECCPKVIDIEENRLIVHNSFDGREGVEIVNELLKNIENKA